MSTRAYVLNVNNPVVPVDLDFPAVALAVSNPTSSPLYIRLGSPDQPTELNADVIVPAASAHTFPVQGYSFCLALGDTSLIVQSGSAALSGLFSTCEVKFLGAGELIPSYGEYSFLSLSVADLTPIPPTFTNPNYISSVFDLLPWGGAVVYVLPAVSTGQGVVSVQASADQSTWFNVVRLAFWPNIPLTINVPKVARYMRLVFNATAIPGEPAIGGIFTVRASLAEINEVTYSAASGTISYGLNIPSLGSQTLYFCTVGLRSVSIRVTFSSGSQAEMVWYTSSVVGNWGLVAYREQSVSGFYNSIFRSLGNLDSFLRVDLLEIANMGPLVGTITVTIQSEPDVTSYLQQIHSDLGDQGQPTNTGQSIYHRLVRIDQNTDGIETLITSTNTFLSTFQTDRRAYTEFFFSGATVTTGGTNVGVNVLTPYYNRYLISCTITVRMRGKRRAPGIILLGIGTSGGINEYIYRVREEQLRSDGSFPPFVYGAGAMGPGKQFITGRNYLWFYADSDAVDIESFMAIR